MKYAYFVGTLFFLIVWAIFYMLRKDLRKEIISVSLVLGFFGIFFEYFWYVRDWVHPTTITQTTVGIEDFVLAFSAGGIATGSYKVFFHKSVYKKSKYHTNWFVVAPLLLAVFVTDFLFRYFGLFSFYANSIGFGVALLIILIIRKDLIKEALLGGLILTGITIPLYWLLFFLYPQFVPFYWNMNNISGVLFLGIPYEDIVWWFVASALISVVYEFCLGLKIRSKSRSWSR